MAEVSVHIETEINQTESEEKVKMAVTNILANASITIISEGKTNILNAEAKGQESLVKLRTLMRNDRVRDASRKALFHSIRGNTISFCLNKQVAFAGHVSFCEETAESPLGPLKITIETDSPQQLIEWLAEKSS
jgi:uncharacterized protein